MKSSDFLSVPSKDRYHRQTLSVGWNQERIREGRVLVVGAGAVGNELIKNLSLSGVGAITILDLDVVEMSNLSRTVLFRESDIGSSKARVAARSILELNPEVNAHWIQGDIEFDIGLGFVREFTIVCGCLDSINARLVLNRLCRLVGVPWINAGISDDAVEISCYGATEGACMECGVSEHTMIIASKRFSCGGLRSLAPNPTIPTNVITASVAGALMANEVLQRLSGHPRRASALEDGQRLTYGLRTQELWSYALSQSDNCPAHSRLARVRQLDLSREASASDVLGLLKMKSGSVQLGHRLLVGATCVDCGDHSQIMMPMGKCSVDVLDCQKCGSQTRTPETIEGIRLTDRLSSATLSSLGVPDRQILEVQQGRKRAHVELRGE